MATSKSILPIVRAAGGDSYVVTLQHVRHGKWTFDLAELRRRLESDLAARPGATALSRLLAHTKRLMLILDRFDDGSDAKAIQTAINAELGLMLLDFERVQKVLGRGMRRG